MTDLLGGVQLWPPQAAELIFTTFSSGGIDPGRLDSWNATAPSSDIAAFFGFAVPAKLAFLHLSL